MTAPVAEGVYTAPPGDPEFTIGWHGIEWAINWLQQPDGPAAGDAWDFTDEQVHHLLHLYAIDELGRFVYRYAMLRRMKGWGKDPLASVIAAIEFLGPCRFSHWENGEPVAVPHSAAWVQVTAVSKDQTRNTMTLFPGLFTQRAIDEYHIDLGKEIIYANRGAKRIEAVTSSPTTLEGGRPTFTIKNETQHWRSNNDGHKMSEVIARNLAKSRDGSSRALAIANAPAPGEDSDAERDYEAWRLGSPGMLYDNREAPDVPDFEDTARLTAALEFARGDSYWLDIDRLVAEIQDPRTPKNMSRRYYLNQLAASEDRAFDSARWQDLADPHDVPEKAPIALGFDGSETDDHSVLIGTELRTGYQWVVGYWAPRQLRSGEIRIPVDEVNASVEEAFNRWRVTRFYADPFYWKEEISRWEGEYNQPGKTRVVTIPTNSYKRMANMLLEFRHAIDVGLVSHDGDERFSAAIRDAHKHYHGFADPNGDPAWTIEKERPDSPLTIDAAMSAVLSWQARLDAVGAGEDQPEPDPGIAFWFPDDDNDESA